MHLIMEYLCVPYAWHAWLQQPHLWVCSQTFCSPRCENSLSLRKTLSWVHGMFLFTMMWPFGNIFHGSRGARLFLGPKLFRENPLLLPLCMVYHGEYLLASQSHIPFDGMLIDTWVGHVYLEILDVLLLLLPWGRNLSVVIMNSC